MTATQEGAEPDSQHGPAAEPRIAKRRAASAVHEVCPYLRSESGAWRSAYAARDHRCGAVTPAARLTIAKQRSLCLVPGHESCATFAAARAAEGISASPAAGDGAALWPAIRSTPVVLEPTRGLMTPLAGVPARTGGQALLVGLMALAFLILVVARTTAPTAPGSPVPLASSGAAGGESAPAPGGSTGAVASSTPGPSTSPVPSSTPGTVTPMPSATPATTPLPGGQTYTVQPGDTMSGIAAKFGTTVKAIAAANNIADPRVIHVGQVLLIP